MTKEYDEKLLKKRDSYKEVTKTKDALKIILITAGDVAGVMHMEHISGVITLEDLFSEDIR